MCIWRASPHNCRGLFYLELAHQYDWAQIASIFPFLACPSIPTLLRAAIEIGSNFSPYRRSTRASGVDAANASRKHMRDDPSLFWGPPPWQEENAYAGALDARARYPPLLPPVSSGHGCRERGATPPLVIPQCFPPFSNGVKEEIGAISGSLF